MTLHEQIKAFFTSESLINLNNGIAISCFLISIPACLFIAFLIFRTNKKYQKRKKELEKIFAEPGTEDLQWFLKNSLSKHGIDKYAASSKKSRPETNNDN